MTSWYLGIGSRYPVARWRAWHSPRTSQRSALLGMGEIVTCIFGGNRSGKTELSRVLAVLYALGGDHPGVRAFLAGNRLPSGLIPKGPGRVYMVALTSNDSIRYHRKRIRSLLPEKGVKWWNFEGRGEARCTIEVPGYRGLAEIYFKSNDQGREGMQGDACRLIVMDEEGSEAVWDECAMRIADPDPYSGAPGKLVLSMTPLKGLTWVYDRYVSTPEEGSRSHWLTATDNPHMDPVFLRKVYRRYGALELAARERGEFVTLEGRVYPLFSRSAHVVRRFDIPAEWPRYRAMDFGVRNPSCVLWGAIGPDDSLYLYREHYRAGWPMSKHADVIKAEETHYSVVCGWADPSARQQILDMRRSHGVSFRPANNSVSLGVSAVKERLALEDDGRPRLFIFDSCINTIKEIENYTLPPDTGNKDPSEKPLKKDDHAMDAMRYLVVGVKRGKLAIG